MNIVILSHMYPSEARPTYGLFIHEHVKALQRCGVKTMVVAPAPWTPPGLAKVRRKWAQYAQIGGRVEFFEGVPVQRPRYPALPGPLDFIRAWTMSASMRCNWSALTAGFDCDLIHAHSITPDGFAACQVGRRLGRPVVCSARGSEVHERPRESRMMKKMTGWTLRNCQAAVAVSGALARTAAALAGSGIEPKVVYNGVAEEFQPGGDRSVTRLQLGLPPTARILLFAGRCEKDKGVEELLQAFALIAAEDGSAVLVIAGEGSARKELERQAQRSSWATRVRFVGQLGRKDVALLFKAADVFVLPSYAEGMPNALLEAMAAGLVCVATPVGGIPEAIEDGVNGLLAPVQSAGAIAAAVKKVFASPALSARLGTAAARTIQNRFTWKANAESHLAIYEEAIRNFHCHPI